MSGRALGVMSSESACKYVTHNYISTVVTQALFIATFACRIVAIVGRTRVAGSGGACTYSFYKCASGVAAASGTLLHTGTFNLVGTADTNQTVTLLADVDTRTFNVGDSLNVVLSGTATSAVGNVTFTFDPVA